ncbi:MAG: TolC family protein [Xanthomonadales bacterium]|nr:TolC family protein [Xanthomonadales bacterium]
MRISKFLLAVLAAGLPLSLFSAESGLLQGALLFDMRPDPELRRFVRSVVDANPRLQAAQSALEASRALESAAGRPLYNPELQADYESAVDDTWEIGIGQTLDWSGKRDARSSVAAAERQAMEAEYLAQRRELTAALLDSLTQHQAGVRRETLASERVQAMSEFADVAGRRFAAGDLNQVEAELATLAAMDARIQRATAEAELAEARQAMRNLVSDLSPERWPSLNTEPPAAPDIDEPQSIVLALPEVAAARRRVQAADAVIELRQRLRKPDPTLILRGGQEADSTLVGINFSIPLYIRNSYSDEVTAAVAERDRAQQLADDLLRRAYARFISATERYRLSHEAWKNWQQVGQPSLARQSDVLRRLWEAGEISTTGFLVQLRQTLDTRENALDLELAMWRAWFEWLMASGQVEAWLGPENPS